MEEINQNNNIERQPIKETILTTNTTIQSPVTSEGFTLMHPAFQYPPVKKLTTPTLSVNTTNDSPANLSYKTISNHMTNDSNIINGITSQYQEKPDKEKRIYKITDLTTKDSGNESEIDLNNDSDVSSECSEEIDLTSGGVTNLTTNGCIDYSNTKIQ